MSCFPPAYASYRLATIAVLAHFPANFGVAIRVQPPSRDARGKLLVAAPYGPGWSSVCLEHNARRRAPVSGRLKVSGEPMTWQRILWGLASVVAALAIGVIAQSR